MNKLIYLAPKGVNEVEIVWAGGGESVVRDKEAPNVKFDRVFREALLNLPRDPCKRVYFSFYPKGAEAPIRAWRGRLAYIDAISALLNIADTWNIQANFNTNTNLMNRIEIVFSCVEVVSSASYEGSLWKFLRTLIDDMGELWMDVEGSVERRIFNARTGRVDKIEVDDGGC